MTAPKPGPAAEILHAVRLGYLLARRPELADLAAPGAVLALAARWSA